MTRWSYLYMMDHIWSYNKIQVLYIIVYIIPSIPIQMIILTIVYDRLRMKLVRWCMIIYNRLHVWSLFLMISIYDQSSYIISNQVNDIVSHMPLNRWETLLISKQISLPIFRKLWKSDQMIISLYDRSYMIIQQNSSFVLNPLYYPYKT